MSPDAVTLRPARPHDSSFCLEVRRLALGPYIEPIWGWDEAAQQRFQDQQFAAQPPHLVIWEERAVGTCEIERHATHLHIGEFFIRPEFQNRGIGTVILQRLLQEADAARLPIHLEVIKINPVRQLYARHGFVITGERESHYLMERPAINGL